MSNETDFWQQFAMSGKIADYLAFKQTTAAPQKKKSTAKKVKATVNPPQDPPSVSG